VKDEDDGIFFITLKDFLQYYSDVEMCKTHDDYHYTSLKAHTNYKNGNFFRMNVPKDGHYYITVNQQSKRHHEKAEDFQYSSVWLILAKEEGDKAKHIEACFKADREVWTDGHLAAGDYLIYVKIAWFDKTTRDFVLSSYGPDDVTFKQVTKQEVPNMVEKIYMDKGRSSKALEDYADVGHPKCMRAIELTDEGYGFIYYQNNEKKTLNEVIEFTELVGLKLCKPFRGQQYQIKVAPGEEKIVLLKIDPQSEEIKQSYSEKANFT